MEKLIGIHKKGNPNNKFGFINNSEINNLFIHDKEFNEDVNRFNGKEVFVSFQIRNSQIKKGYTEGYNGCTIESETDVDLLISFLKTIINVKPSLFPEFQKIKLCKELIVKLKDLSAAQEKTVIFPNYFQGDIDQLIIEYSSSSEFLIMKFGLEIFYPVKNTEIESLIEKNQELKLLREMGFQGADKYEALTKLFFANYELFEKFYYKFPQNVSKEFIYKIILESETLPFESSFESLRKFVELIKMNHSTIESENAFTLFSNLSTPKIRLYLWLNNLTDVFNFDEYKEHVWLLERKDQSIFVKKLFYWKSINKIDFTLDNLNEIKVFNISNFRDIKQLHTDVDFNNLDFNVSLLVFILGNISGLNNKDNNFMAHFFEYFLEYVQDYKEIQRIDYFYPKCIGRTRGQKKSVIIPEFGENGEPIDIETFEYSYFHNENDKPLYHNFCDGVLDTKNILDFPTDKSYCWCTGLPCFNPSNTYQTQKKDYQEWTIIDFLRILNLPFQQKNISYLLGYINKTNLLIDRLKCSGCNNLLNPSNQNKSTYHVINNFHCNTVNCTEFNKQVYLNHCHNKHCSNIIDSRVSKKCKHDGYDDYWGWTICDSCYSCCSTKKYLSIRNRREQQGNTWNGPTIGHDELTKTFCYHCGDKMKLQINFYEKQLRLINNILNSKNQNFVKAREKKNGKWKFTLDFNILPIYDRENKIEILKNAGFQIVETKVNNVLNVNHLYTVALMCVNENCKNKEIFTPIKTSNWKPFSDNHKKLIEAVEMFFETNDAKFLMH